EFAGLKNFAAFQAFDKFSVLFSGYDANTGMPAKLFRRVLLGGWTWAWWILARLHIRTMARSACAGWRIAGIVSPSRRLSSVSREPLIHKTEVIEPAMATDKCLRPWLRKS